MDPNTRVNTGGGAAEKVAYVVETLTDAFNPVTDKFETKYGAWKATWSSGASLNSGRSSDRATGPEWDALVAMTPKIIPYVVHKLSSPGEHFAVQLYNKLQGDPTKKVPRTDIQTYYSLNLHSKEITRLYSTLVIAPFESKVTEWEAHQRRNMLSSSSTAYINADSYRALVAMGKDQIVPLVMAKYAKDQDGWWHELLYELEYGRKSNAHAFQKQELFQKWKGWFEGV